MAAAPTHRLFGALLVDDAGALRRLLEAGLDEDLDEFDERLFGALATSRPLSAFDATRSGRPCGLGRMSACARCSSARRSCRA